MMKPRRGLRRVAAVLLAFASLLTLPALGSALAPTTAAWTDTVYAAAPVTAGTWGPVTGCTWYVDGAPQPGATCTVTGGQVTGQYEDPWGSGVWRRQYSLSVTSTGSGSGYPVIAFDLSTLPGGNAGTWNWSTAVTLPGGHLTPLPGFLCSELPVLRAQGPANWGTSLSYFFELKSPSSGAPKTCG